MVKPLPAFVNNRRRTNLNRYSILGMLSYQLPVGVAFLAKLLGLARYDYTDIMHTYMGFIACSISTLFIIRLKKQITKRFIYFMLYYQVLTCMFISAYMVYVMSDQRYLVPIGVLAILTFVFIQSTLRASFVTIILTVILYLSASYVGIVISGQPGSFMSEVLYIMIFVPICLFNAYMSKKMQDQQLKLNNANSKLKTTHTALETHNEKMLESIRYAELIQRSLLPGIERIKAVSPDSMFIWMPKDIVGGDIFYTYADRDSCIITLMDCTGHGVPGAFLTMLVYSEIRKIIIDEACREPSIILKRMNRAVKNVLHSNSKNGADDGLDAAVCNIDHSGRKVTYAGARMPLFHVNNNNVYKVKGDKQSLGYKDDNTDFNFTSHTIEVEENCSFYLITDGFTDQLGGEKRRRFGTNKFKQLIQKHHHKPFSEQRPEFIQALTTYQGDNEQIDDMTLIGFHM